MLRAVFSKSLQRTPGRRCVRRRIASYRPELLDLESRTLLSTITWLRPVSGDWDTAANWAGGRVPAGLDNVVIPFRGITVTHSTASTVVVSLTSEADLDIVAGNLGLTGGRIDGLVTVRDGASLTMGTDPSVDQVVDILDGAGTLRNFGTLHLLNMSTFNVAVDNEGLFLDDGGNVNNDATRPFINGPGATLRGGGEMINGFVNQGRIEFTRDVLANLVVRNGTVVNAPGATIDFNSGFGSNASSLIADLDNQGTITAEGPGSLSLFNESIGRSGGTVTNEGTITVTGALGIFQSAFTNSGTITLANSGAVFVVNGGTFSPDGGSLSGPGKLGLLDITATLTPDETNAVAGLDVSGSTITSPGTLTNLVGIGGSTINADVVNHGNLNGIGSTSISTGNVTTINGTFTNAAGATLLVESEFVTPRLLTVTGGFTNNGSVVVANATLTVTSGTLTNATGATINIGVGNDNDSADTSLLNAALVNQGTLTIFQPTILTGTVTNNGAIDIRSFGDLRVNQGDSTSQDLTFVNTGGVTVRSLRSLTVQGGDFANSGTVSLTGFSSILVSRNYVQTGGSTQLNDGLLTAGGLLDLEGGALAGTGVINANVLNNAELDVGQLGSPGVLAIVGDYNQTAGGMLVVEIGGPNPGIDFDQLNITGHATLDGTLTVNLINGFVPNSGDSFTSLTFGSETGTFATLAGDGPEFTPVFDSTDVTLVAN